MSSFNKSSSKVKTSSKTKSENKFVISDKSPLHVWKQHANDLKKDNEHLRIQNDQLQENVKDLESKCEAIMKTVFGQEMAGDCLVNTPFSGLLKQPLEEVLVKLREVQKKQSDVGTLSSRIEELETRLTSNYDEIAKLMRIKMKVENCLEKILMSSDLTKAKDAAKKTLDECSEVYLFLSNSEVKMLNSTSLNMEEPKNKNNSAQTIQQLPQLMKPSQKSPGDTHISKIEPDLKRHIFYELNKETRKGNDWRLLAERVGIEQATINTWQEHKLDNPMVNVWSVWGQSPAATVRMLHRHLISPQMKNSLLARKVSDFYLVS